MEDKCIFCGQPLRHEFVDLGLMPLTNEYLPSNTEIKGQIFYPLKLYVCGKCLLVQAKVFAKPETIFSDYKYFSSYSSSWLEHCKQYVGNIVEKRKLSQTSLVVEIACNDGYLLQYFKPLGIPSYGVEPSQTVAKVAVEKGIDVEIDFFSADLARQLVSRKGKADLIICNNVLAHNPYINSFVEGLKILLKPDGIITVELPHLLNLIRYNQFDTIYHEHFSYFSLTALVKIFDKVGLCIVGIEQLDTHGGSLRLYISHIGNAPIDKSVGEILESERLYGLTEIDTYTKFRKSVEKIKFKSLKILVDLKSQNKRIAAFGAAAKGNTFLNYCGVGKDIVEYIVDSNPSKQGYLTPGNLIPIVDVRHLIDNPPDYLIILPWNLRDEIKNQVRQIIPNWDGRFITFIPQCDIF